MPRNDTGRTDPQDTQSVAAAAQSPCVTDTLSALTSQIQPNVSQEDFSFLLSMLRERSLLPLLKMHERLKQYKDQRPPPVLLFTGALANELFRYLQSITDCEEVKELSNLLISPHIKNLLSVHDAVAQKRFGPSLPPLPKDLGEEDQDSVKIIQLVKNMEPLGATLKQDEDTGAVVIARILKGGVADLSGLIHEGDQLKEVNGVLLKNKKPEDVAPMVAQSGRAVTFKVVPSIKEESPAPERELFVRALFDYNPLEDQAIPCKEAGLAFRKGDVLQVLKWAEPLWWQARIFGGCTARAGLVPSRELQERRILLRRATECVLRQAPEQSAGDSAKEGEAADYGAISGVHIAGLRRSFRLSRRNWRVGLCECAWNQCYNQSEAPTYEEVVPYLRRPDEPFRLVLLVGPRRVGMNEMKRRLLISDPEHFGVPVPYTTRPRRAQEIDGVEYKFVSRQQFEADILDNKYIDYGQYGGNYYGTHLDSVQSVLRENKVCLLDVPAQRIQIVRTCEFKPYVVFVKPPEIEKLRLTRRNVRVAHYRDGKSWTGPLTEEDFQEMLDSARLMEEKYGHLFDRAVINEDMASAFTELSTALRGLEEEVQWIPESWEGP